MKVTSNSRAGKPSVPDDGITDLLLGVLRTSPSTLLGIGRALPDMNKSTTQRRVRLMHLAGMVHVVDWVKESPTDSGRYARVFAAGPGRDAPEPPLSAATVAERERRAGHPHGLQGKPQQEPLFRPKVSAADNPFAGLFR